MAVVRREKGDLSGAVEDLERALEVAEPDSPHRQRIEQLRSRLLEQLEQQR
jgi:cytochrome c-type biogenesis protein CcmH/NrfG